MDGLLVVNKEKGYTSRDIVNIISKALNNKKVGHTGTLDPLATGVLVVAVGKALKIVDLLTNDRKEYLATVKLGIATDTLDITGKILYQQETFSLEYQKLLDVLSTFLGNQYQQVPLYSAVRVKGKRLYEYARKNEEVELPKREIEIFEIELLSLSEEEFSFRVIVSKGTYIRSLIRDIGEKLNIACTMSQLQRIKQGSFSLEQSYTLEEIQNGSYHLLPLVPYLTGYELVEADEFLQTLIKNGRILENRYQNKNIAFIDQQNRLLAIYEPYQKDLSKIKPKKILM